mmetsp:Transcript_123102/g.359432  ORF Transcript_123102/g.359432 Transcript_123102/m.359432 type:complete len:264 (-) Transcript_123102:3947-4738(-)
MSRSWRDFRRAADAWPSLRATTVSQASCTRSTVPAAVRSKPSTCCLSFSISCLASCQGPLVALGTLLSCVSRHSFASAAAVDSPVAAAVVAERTVSGVAAEATSDSATEVNGDAASSTCFAAICTFSTFSLMALRIRDAAFLSFFSSCFLFSNSSRFECSRLPSSTFLASWSSLIRITLTLGFILFSSVFTSAKGPSLHSRRSKLFAFKKATTFCAASRAELRVLFRLFMYAAKAVNGLKYVVPWFPCMVAHPFVFSPPSLST